MSSIGRQADSMVSVNSIRAILKSQYHASLAMLRESIERCTEDLWLNRDQINAFWQVAYHTLFFTHLYLMPNPEAFVPWREHQSQVQHPDGIAGRADETSTLPLIPRPYTRDQVLEYWRLCDGMVDAAVDAVDPAGAESGFSWYKTSRLEHQIINIRHIQIGAAQLAGRLRASLNIGVKWVGAAPRGEAV